MRVVVDSTPPTMLEATAVFVENAAGAVQCQAAGLALLSKTISSELLRSFEVARVVADSTPPTMLDATAGFPERTAGAAEIVGRLADLMPPRLHRQRAAVSLSVGFVAEPLEVVARSCWDKKTKGHLD